MRPGPATPRGEHAVSRKAPRETGRASSFRRRLRPREHTTRLLPDDRRESAPNRAAAAHGHRMTTCLGCRDAARYVARPGLRAHAASPGLRRCHLARDALRVRSPPDRRPADRKVARRPRGQQPTLRGLRRFALPDAGDRRPVLRGDRAGPGLQDGPERCGTPGRRRVPGRRDRLPFVAVHVPPTRPFAALRACAVQRKRAWRLPSP